MKEVPKQTYNIKSNILFTIIASLFLLAFAILYTPSFGTEIEYLEQWSTKSNFCIPILCAIAFLTIAFSRFLLVLFSHKRHQSKTEYLIWQVCELLAIAFFSNIFISLYSYLAELTLTNKMVLHCALLPPLI